MKTIKMSKDYSICYFHETDMKYSLTCRNIKL